MAKLTKKQKAANAKYDATKLYTLKEATKVVKDITYTKFDASVDLSIRLGVDPRKEATAAGADYVGLDEYIQKIEKGWTDIDIVITMPSVMAKVGKLGKILGPRNLMPNPKTGTVTTDVGKAVTEVKAGKIDFKVDKQGSIHTSVGKVSFDPIKLEENAREIVNSIIKLKPSAAKGTYLKSVSLSSTMSGGIHIDTKSVS
ncbi:MAG: 50S ribosomal protein L1 [Bacteroidetes bacterium]|nr:50S ribosomal protein L1 [Bacteroidota bacterium]